MLVTLEDGIATALFNTETMSVNPYRVNVFNGKHGLRLHVYDPETGDASKKFVTHDKALQDSIMRAIRNRSGQICHQNTWIKPKISRQEFWDDSNTRRMVKRDLEQYYTGVQIRGNSIRYIYYVSDGQMSSTPDAIGVMFNKPLVYEGLAIATVFDIQGKDPLRPGKNIVHWLTKPMWEGFHSRRRKIPKDFPGPTGFVASHWCQREGYSTYNNKEIRIASMTQGQSVGRWAATSMRQFWLERQGVNIFPDMGQTFKLAPPKQSSTPSAILTAMSHAVSGKTSYGMIGIYCSNCGEMLPEPYGKCPGCGYSNSTYDCANKMFCVECGKTEDSICDCGDPFCGFSIIGCQCASPHFVKMTQKMHKEQHRVLITGKPGKPLVVGSEIVLAEE